MNSRRAQADLALAVCSLLWGASFVVVKDALGYASVLVFLAVRFTLAALIMIALRPAALRGLKKSGFLVGLALGCFMFAGYTFQTAGLLYTTPSKSAFVTGFSVVLVPLLLAIFWRRRLAVWAYLGAASALLGLYFLTVPVSGLSHLNRGDLLTLACAAMYALHIIWVGEYGKKHPVAALAITQVTLCGAFAWIAVYVAKAGNWEMPRLEWRWELYVAVTICAVFATAVAYLLQLWAQKYTTASHAAILFTLEPVFAAVFSYFLAGERLAPRSMIGGVFVLVGILLAELLGAPAAPESMG
jgi:drug/metabolite transporter (DMT)-like permease